MTAPSIWEASEPAPKPVLSASSLLFPSVKHWEKGCQMLPAWIYGWGAPCSEVLWGIPRLTGELMAFDTFLSFFFGMWVCLWVRERDNWVGVTSSFCSSSPGIGCGLLWDVRHAAAMCRYCKGSPVGLLNSWDNCWDLCTSCFRSCCPSSKNWGGVALWPARPRLCESLKFQMVSPPLLLFSLYLPFSRSNFIPPTW